VAERVESAGSVSGLPDAPALLVDRAGVVMRASAAVGTLAGVDDPEKFVGRHLRDVLIGTEPDLRLSLGEGEGVPVRVVRWRVPGSGLDAVLLTDVSDFVTTTRTLTAERRRFAEAQQLAKMGWWEFDHVTHETIWSDTLHDMLGAEPGSIAPGLATMLRYIHPDDVDRARVHCRRPDPLGARHRGGPAARESFERAGDRLRAGRDRPAPHEAHPGRGPCRAGRGAADRQDGQFHLRPGDQRDPAQ
jgi:PAS domain-containing protein